MGVPFHRAERRVARVDRRCAAIVCRLRLSKGGLVTNERAEEVPVAKERSSGPSVKPLAAANLVAAFFGFSALVTELATLAAKHRFNAGNFFSFFSFFTIEANMLAAISLALSSLALAGGTLSRTLDLCRGAVTLYMTTTIMIFIVLLSGYPCKDLTAVPWDNTVLHYLMPIIIILDLLLAPPARGIAYRSGATWLAFPLAYLLYGLIRGHIVHWYPYPFMNPAHNGHLGLIITAIVIAVILAAITWIISITPASSERLLRTRTRTGRRPQYVRTAVSGG
ncbi:MAG: FAR7a/AIG1-like family protein [Frankiales bacterium]|nr:FAR7a/AIG1-like family protein [Frankiales bacterium]